MNKNIVWIESNCDNYYRLISKVESLSIKIYEVKYIDKKLYLKVTKVPDSWSFMTLSEYLLKFDLTDYNGERSPGYPLLIALGFGRL